MKKLLLTLGSATAVVAPLATTVACGFSEFTNYETITNSDAVGEAIENMIDGAVYDALLADLIAQAPDGGYADETEVVTEYDILAAGKYSTYDINVLYHVRDEDGEIIETPDYARIDMTIAAGTIFETIIVLNGVYLKVPEGFEEATYASAVETYYGVDLAFLSAADFTEDLIEAEVLPE